MLQKKIRKLIAAMVLICLCLYQIGAVIQTVSASEYLSAVAATKEIDMGDYQSQMVVGETQLLSITVLPMDDGNQNISYSSSDTSVAKINGIGRITALKAGVTEIAVSCGGVTEKFGLTVVNAQSVRDLDLGDCPDELEVGTSQILSVTIIPEEASSTAKIFYQTSDAGIATVNEIGRVTGIKEGKVTITVTCGNIKKELHLKIVKAKSNEIAVTDIEIADYEDELEVDKTMTLTATVIPANATDSMVTYKSSDENIATVNSSGEVKGIAEGSVTITVSAGTIIKQVDLKVKVATAKIELDTTYLVLRAGESHQLMAKVVPAEADQQIIFESTAPEIVSVSAVGVITANQCGSGEIIVRNGDISTAVTVIVNLMGEEEKEQEKGMQQEKAEYKNETYVEDCLLITADMLKYYYTQNENLTVYGSGYVIKIVGGQIENWENELYTNIKLKKEKQGTGFELNRSKKICGPVTIQFDESTLSGKYVYLYNTSKGKYELLKGQDTTSLQLDTEGKYLVTQKKLPNGKGSLVALIIAVGIIAILLGIYIAVKRQYWFW